ncbi:MAG: photosystem II reaction center protein Psb28 [Arthrospira sp. SH-MAG29]|nr:photosystem II reaction center protein Psb28 [Arthrospira sp. SH-MAG29]MBS0014981.1 photosystem II reaction center protein Psb28 [Arthrospira sp. SH-MAG29]
MSTSIQFIDGLDEELGGVSLRKRRDSNTKIVVLVFKQLKAIEKLRAYRKQISHLWLRDEEGEIRVSPTGVRFFYLEDDELSKAECTFEVDSEDILGRVMRFLHRYADDHGFEYNAN